MPLRASESITIHVIEPQFYVEPWLPSLEADSGGQILSAQAWLSLPGCPFPQGHGSSGPWDVCTLISLAYDAALIRALLQVTIYPGKLSDLIPHLLTNRTI